jgi:hypothetical protein
MKILKAPFFLVLMLIVLTANCQEPTVIRGRVIDQELKTGLAYVNIGLRHTNAGTVSSESGAFQLTIPSTAVGDSVQFSYMGYGTERFALKNLLDGENIVALPRKSILLSEAIVNPVSAEEYVRRAIDRVTANYADKSLLATGDYYSFTSFNETQEKSLKEAVVSTYVPGSNDKQELHSSILHARIINKSVQKETNTGSNRKQEKWNTIDSILPTMFEMMLGDELSGIDPVHDDDAYFFLQPSKFKKFKFHLDEVVSYGDRRMLVISFDQLKRIKRDLTKGKIFIDTESFAIAAIEYEGVFKVPGILKLMLAPFGLDWDEVRYTESVQYREFSDKWFITSKHHTYYFDMERTKVFQSNEDKITFIEQSFVVTDLQTNEVQPIEEAKRIKQGVPWDEQALDPDPSFWDTYNPNRPKKFEAVLEQE